MKPLILLLLSAFTAFGAASTNVSFFKGIDATSVVIGPTNVVGALSSKAELVSPGFTTPSLGAATALTLDTGQGAKELYGMDQDVLTTSSPTFGSLTVTTNMAVGEAPIAGRRMAIRRDNLTTLPVDGLFLTNATPATVGVQVQVSPAIIQTGNGWLTGSASNSWINYRQYVLPSAANPTLGRGDWKLERSYATAAFTTLVTVNDLGTMTVFGDLSVSAGTFVTSASYFGFSGGPVISKIAASEMRVWDASSKIATVQANTPQITKTANYTIVALDSGLRFNNIGSVIATTNTLPTAVAAQHYWQHIDAAQIVSLKASGSDVIRWGSTVSGAAGDIWSSQVGSVLHLFCPKAGLWVVDYAVGGWTLVAPRSGNLTLIGGTLTVANTTVTANSALFLTRKTSGGTIGFAVNYTLSAGTSFTVTSDNVLDTSVYSWKLEEIPN